MRVYLYIYFSLTTYLALAQTPTWTVDPSFYSNSMVVVGVVYFDYRESVDDEDMIAAFVGEEIRGVAQLSLIPETDLHLAFLVIYSNTAGEEITFKAYDASAENVVEILGTVDFEVDGLIGDGAEPFIWSDRGILGMKPSTKVKVYPTLVSNEVTVESITGEPYFLSLMDLEGRILMKECVQSPEKGLELGLLNTGIYLLRLDFGECVETYRLIKE